MRGGGGRRGSLTNNDELVPYGRFARGVSVLGVGRPRNEIDVELRAHSRASFSEPAIEIVISRIGNVQLICNNCDEGGGDTIE